MHLCDGELVFAMHGLTVVDKAAVDAGGELLLELVDDLGALLAARRLELVEASVAELAHALGELVLDVDAGGARRLDLGAHLSLERRLLGQLRLAARYVLDELGEPAALLVELEALLLELGERVAALARLVVERVLVELVLALQRVQLLGDGHVVLGALLAQALIVALLRLAQLDAHALAERIVVHRLLERVALGGQLGQLGLDGRQLALVRLVLLQRRLVARLRRLKLLQQVSCILFYLLFIQSKFKYNLINRLFQLKYQHLPHCLIGGTDLLSISYLREVFFVGLD